MTFLLPITIMAFHTAPSYATSSQVGTEIRDCLQVYYFGISPRPTQPGHPSTDTQNDGHCLCLGRNGEFCITIFPVTRTAGIQKG